jgi:hypothetical protein
MDPKIFEILNDKFDQQICSQEEVLCDGSAKSYDHYKELCGVIRGLRIAQYELKDLARKLKDTDD